MVKRMILMLAIVTAGLAVIGFVKYRQVQAAIQQAGAFQPPPEAVTTTVAREESWHGFLGAIGTVQAVRGVTVSADAPGLVERIRFESGALAHEGETLVQLDTRQEQAQLAAAEAQRALAQNNHTRLTDLLAKKVVSQAEYDATQATLAEAEARVGEIRATIGRKTIRAPFTGLLGIRQVNLGQYLESGAPVVALQSFDPIYVNFSVPQQELGQIRIGGAVHVTPDGTTPVELSGTITAIEPVVDPSTRNVAVQATFANPERALKPGMFVKPEIVLDENRSVVPIPATAVSYAPYGDSVFIVEDMKGPDGKPYRGARQQFVKLGPARGDLVPVVEGVRPGDEIVTTGLFRLRNGSAVQVNNETLPGASATPRPEDN